MRLRFIGLFILSASLIAVLASFLVIANRERQLMAISPSISLSEIVTRFGHPWREATRTAGPRGLLDFASCADQERISRVVVYRVPFRPAVLLYLDHRNQLLCKHRATMPGPTD